MIDPVRQHLIFEGTVQNVGFRYEMTRLAQQHGLTGWVRNVEDGTVEAQVQGPLYSINALLDELNTISHIHITAVHRTFLPVIVGEVSFLTRYY